MATDDELAQTATAPATPSALASAPQVLGRFRIEAKLGEGGMGIVHAAFDGELERRIAVKLLRDAGSADARARLLREARAMAKLSHPNVITVFEVGSVEGHDFVAMELIDGETLAEWLRRARPDVRAIASAFVAAGRGLVAAHAAGLVHRDFKPGNVLRSHAGKIVVTDFGLARADRLAGEPVAGDAKPTTRTATGAVLGTPAYMAPEQWTGSAVTPQTDQFAFCVSLWEALAGERPFEGATLDQLQAAVLAGNPRGADRLPRPWRPILRRGLAVDPAQRWPTMDALLAAIERVTRRRSRRLLLIAALAIAAIAGVAIGWPASTHGGCAPPALDPDRVWSGNRMIALALRDPDSYKLVTSDRGLWRELRSDMCSRPVAQREDKLRCLDVALERLDHALGSALAHAGRVDPDSLGVELVDPAMCERTPSPVLERLGTELSSAFDIARYSKGVSPLSADEVARAEKLSSPCARAVKLISDRVNPWSSGDFSGMLRAIEVLRDLETHCEDDSIRAAVALALAANDDDPKHAEAAVARFPQTDFWGALETIRGQHAAVRASWDAAVTHHENALLHYRNRRQRRAQLGAVIELAKALEQRGGPDDARRVQALAAEWMPVTTATERAQLDIVVQRMRWQTGALASADAALERLGAVSPSPNLLISRPRPGIGVTGEVVDPSGAPVANAIVASGGPVVGDSVTVATAQYTVSRRTTRTDRDGKFSLLIASGTVVAQAGALRSTGVAVAPHVRLVVRPTSRLEGRVSGPTSRTWVLAHPANRDPGDDVALVAPVQADGRFVLDGVPRTKLVIGAVELGVVGVGGRPRQLTVDRERIDGIALDRSPTLYVIARSADLVPPDSALVMLLQGVEPGPHPHLNAVVQKATAKVEAEGARIVRADTLRSAFPSKIDLDHVPPPLAGKVHADDMVATLADATTDKTFACAIGFSKRQLDVSLDALAKGFLNQEVVCTRVIAGQSILTLALPSMRKLAP